MLPCADGAVVPLLVVYFLTLRSLLPPSGQRVVLPRNSTSSLSGFLAVLLALSEELWDDLCASAVGAGRRLGGTCEMRRNALADARSFGEVDCFCALVAFADARFLSLAGGSSSALLLGGSESICWGRWRFSLPADVASLLAANC